MKKHLVLTSIALGAALCVIIGLLVYTFKDSAKLSEQPTLEEAEIYFKENRNDLEIVADFLRKQENDVVIVRYAHRWENWKDTELTGEVRRAIKRLRNGQNRIIITKDVDAINITIWCPAILEQSSGFVYSLKNTEMPDIAYATVLEPMSEPGWYFYVEDFNTWRTQNTSQTKTAGCLRNP